MSEDAGIETVRLQLWHWLSDALARSHPKTAIDLFLRLKILPLAILGGGGQTGNVLLTIASTAAGRRYSENKNKWLNKNNDI